MWTCTTISEDKFTVKLILQVFKLKKNSTKFEENLNMFYYQRMSFGEILHLFLYFLECINHNYLKIPFPVSDSPIVLSCFYCRLSPSSTPWCFGLLVLFLLRCNFWLDSGQCGWKILEALVLSSSRDDYVFFKHADNFGGWIKFSLVFVVCYIKSSLFELSTYF